MSDPTVRVYADYMGAGIMPKPLAEAIAADVLAQSDPASTLFRSNPHSGHRPGHEAHRLLSNARAAVAAFFGAGDEYEVIFTSGCTGALQAAGRGFDFDRSPSSSAKVESVFACSWLAHNSLLGLREIAMAGSGGGYLPLKATTPWAHMPRTVLSLQDGDVFTDNANTTCSAAGVKRVLWGFPLECNYSGGRAPYLDWAAAAADARDASANTGLKVYTLLDAAAGAPRMPIALRGSRVDFMTVSFYKMFGYPTGLGALLVRKATARETMPKATDGSGYFGGGTVDLSAFDEPYHIMRGNLAEALEAGTPNFHGIAYVERGLRSLVQAVDPMAAGTGVAGDSDEDPHHHHVMSTPECHAAMSKLAARLHTLQSSLAEKLGALKHATTGRPIVRLHRDNASGSVAGTIESQGPTVALCVLDDDGAPIGHGLVEKLAGQQGIACRAGCFCNPGACGRFVGFSVKDLRRFHDELHHSCSDMHDVIDGQATGAARFSLGLFTTMADVDAIVDFIATSFGRRAVTTGAAATEDTTPSSVATTVQSMFVFPVKGVVGFEAAQWAVTPSGFLLDRDWAIVSAVDGSAVTPKKNAAMSHIIAAVNPALQTLVLSCRPEHADELARVTGKPLARTSVAVAIADPTYCRSVGVDVGDLSKQLAACVPHVAHETKRLGDRAVSGLLGGHSVVAAADDGGAATTTSIRGRKMDATTRYPAEVDGWLSAVLQQPVHLVRKSGGDKADATAATTFSNSGAFLVVSDASHKAVIRQLETPAERRAVTVDNYRANIVVSAATGFEENRWRGLTLTGGQGGEVQLALSSTGNCTRCSQVGVGKDGKSCGAALQAIASLTRRARAAAADPACQRPGAAGNGSSTSNPGAEAAVLGELFAVAQTKVNLDRERAAAANSAAAVVHDSAAQANTALPIACGIVTLGIAGLATLKAGSSNPVAPVVAAGVAAAAATKVMAFVWGSAVAANTTTAAYAGPVEACVLRVGDTFTPTAKQ